jgi:hypothetical protein
MINWSSVGIIAVVALAAAARPAMKQTISARRTGKGPRDVVLQRIGSIIRFLPVNARLTAPGILGILIYVQYEENAGGSNFRSTNYKR